MAAYWLVVGALIMANWCSFTIREIISLGPAAYPRRQPVMEWAFEKPLTTMVRSIIPGSEEKHICPSWV